LNDKALKKLEIINNMEQIETLLHLDHPFVNRVFDEFKQDNGKHCIVQEFFQNNTLEKVVQRFKHSGKLMQETEIISYFIQISFALLYIHDMGIVHGNMKLSNIIYRDVGGKHMMRISDF
jgi:serine/threonine protein kinase